MVDLRKVYVTKNPKLAPKGAKLITTKRNAVYYDTDDLKGVKTNDVKPSVTTPEKKDTPPKKKRLYIKEGKRYHPSFEVKKTKTGRGYIEYDGKKPAEYTGIDSLNDLTTLLEQKSGDTTVIQKYKKLYYNEELSDKTNRHISRYVLENKSYKVLSVGDDIFESLKGYKGEGAISDGVGNTIAIIYKNNIIQPYRGLLAVPYISARRLRETQKHPLPQDMMESIISSVMATDHYAQFGDYDPSYDKMIDYYRSILGKQGSRDVALKAILSHYDINMNDLYASLKTAPYDNPSGWLFNQIKKDYPEAPKELLSSLKKSLSSENCFNDEFLKTVSKLAHFYDPKLDFGSDHIANNAVQICNDGIYLKYMSDGALKCKNFGILDNIIFKLDDQNIHTKRQDLYKVVNEHGNTVVYLRKGVNALSKESQFDIIHKVMGDLVYEKLNSIGALPLSDLFTDDPETRKDLFVQTFINQSKDATTLSDDDIKRRHELKALVYNKMYTDSPLVYFNTTPEGMKNKSMVDDLAQRYSDVSKNAEHAQRLTIKLRETIDPVERARLERNIAEALGLSTDESSRVAELRSKSEQINLKATALQEEYLKRVNGYCEQTGADLDDVLERLPLLDPTADKIFKEFNELCRQASEYNKEALALKEKNSLSAIETEIMALTGGLTSDTPLIVKQSTYPGYTDIPDKTAFNKTVTHVSDWFRTHVSESLWNKIRLSAGVITSGRAHCNSNTSDGSIIGISKGGFISASTLIHEIGHAIEHDNPKVKSEINEFYNRRTAASELSRLKDILPSSGYDNDEYTKTDSFPDPYCGKVYSDHATELLSMGLQFMYEDPNLFMKKDPEYFNLIYDIMKGCYV